MQTLIFLPTQGPHLERPGPAEHFDWRVQCRIAATLQKASLNSVIYVPSAFQQTGTKSELTFYGDQLRAEGVPEEALRLDEHGLETVEQCELALALADREQARMVVIVCHVQVMRVRYLLRDHNVEFIIAKGTPNIGLHFTSLILGVLFPIIDVLKLRGWWKQRIARRRARGKQ